MVGRAELAGPNEPQVDSTGGGDFHRPALRRGPGAHFRKIDNFSTSPAGACTVLQKARTGPAGASHDARASLRQSKAGTDSGMAPQAVEIAQNGLGQNDPPARCRGSRRIAQANSVSDAPTRSRQALEMRRLRLRSSADELGHAVTKLGEVRKLRKGAVKLLKSFARVTSCARSSSGPRAGF